ncbi:hypothetical protein ZIOFF_021665 [Zingiber officinale]|uniref:Uncharacterized protein n=1 Tax=Zingiber officinale TaxID=94328 RepID=A0A8J5H0K7_ZINOF|nr:hypothetical protein ZIOFF_021665 [Zingiber officinale]
MDSRRYMAYSPSPSSVPYSPHISGIRTPSGAIGEQENARADAGMTKMYSELEDLFTRFMGKPVAITFAMGYVTNSFIIPTLTGEICLVISDSFNHNLIVNGALASGAAVQDDVNTVSFAYRTVMILFSCSDDNPCKIAPSHYDESVWNRRCFAAIKKTTDSCKTKNLQKLDEDEEYAQIMARIEELERMEELENGNTSKDNTQENKYTVVHDGVG